MMLFILLLTGLAQAADLSRECNLHDAGLQRFFAEYTRAYARAKRAQVVLVREWA